MVQGRTALALAALLALGLSPARSAFTCDTGATSSACVVSTAQVLTEDVEVSGAGSLEVTSTGSLMCALPGCRIALAFDGTVSIAGSIKSADIEVNGSSVELTASARIDASGQGPASAASTGRGHVGSGSCTGGISGGGGALGGAGSDGQGSSPSSGCPASSLVPGPGGRAHGDSVFSDSAMPGSPGGAAAVLYRNPGQTSVTVLAVADGALGGGVVRITATSGSISTGTSVIVSADGADGSYSSEAMASAGGGSGGTIALRAPAGSISGSAVVSASGGSISSASGSRGGAGGGGRVLLQTARAWAVAGAAAPGSLDTALRPRAYGGNTRVAVPGAAGTIAHVAEGGSRSVSLTVDNGGRISPHVTVLSLADAPTTFAAPVQAGGSRPGTWQYPTAAEEAALSASARRWGSVVITGNAVVSPIVTSTAVAAVTAAEALEAGATLPRGTWAADPLTAPNGTLVPARGVSSTYEQALFALDPPMLSRSVAAGDWRDLAGAAGAAATWMTNSSADLPAASSAIFAAQLIVGSGSKLVGPGHFDVVTVDADVEGELSAGERLRVRDAQMTQSQAAAALPGQWGSRVAACAEQANAEALRAYVVSVGVGADDDPAHAAVRGNNGTQLRSADLATGFLSVSTSRPELVTVLPRPATITSLAVAPLDSAALGAAGDLHALSVDVSPDFGLTWKDAPLAAPIGASHSIAEPSLIHFSEPVNTTGVRLVLGTSRRIGVGMMRMVCDAARGLRVRGTSAKVTCLADGCAVSLDQSGTRLPVVVDAGGTVEAPRVDVRAPSVFLQRLESTTGGTVTASSSGFRSSAGPGAGRSAAPLSWNPSCPTPGASGSGASHAGTGGMACFRLSTCYEQPTAWRNFRGASGSEPDEETYEGAFNATYGSIVAPSSLGSGGGAAVDGGVPRGSGGRGGGAVRIQASWGALGASFAVRGTGGSSADSLAGLVVIAASAKVVADGGPGSIGAGSAVQYRGGAGAGGSVVVVGSRLMGGGTVSADGGGNPSSSNAFGGNGGGGRISITAEDDLDSSASAGRTPSLFARSSTVGACYGGAGTIFTSENGRTTVAVSHIVQQSTLQAVTPLHAGALDEISGLGQLQVGPGAAVAPRSSAALSWAHGTFHTAAGRASVGIESAAVVRAGAVRVMPQGALLGDAVSVHAFEVVVAPLGVVKAVRGASLVADGRRPDVAVGSRSVHSCSKNAGADPDTGSRSNITWDWSGGMSGFHSTGGYNEGSFLRASSLFDGQPSTGFYTYQTHPRISFPEPTWVSGFEIMGPAFLPDGTPETYGHRLFIQARAPGGSMTTVPHVSTGHDDRVQNDMLRQVRFVEPVLAEELTIAHREGASRRHIALSEFRPFCLPGGMSVLGPDDERDVQVSCTRRLCPVRVQSLGFSASDTANAGERHLLLEATVKGGNVTVVSDSAVEAYGLVSATGMGYGPGDGPGSPRAPTLGDELRAASGPGGSHGGTGGPNRQLEGLGTTLPSNPPISYAGPAYGLALAPHLAFGSGGADPAHVSPATAGAWRGTGGSGGGAVVVLTPTTLHFGSVYGSVVADGTPPAALSGSTIRGGGGSGGGVLVDAGSVSGRGVVTANGGQSTHSTQASGAGGGGRLLVRSRSGVLSSRVEGKAEPGIGYGQTGVDSRLAAGAAGTVVVEAAATRTLIISDRSGTNRNTGLALSVEGVTTPLPADLDGVRLDRVVITRLALLAMPAGSTLRAEALRLDAGSRINGSAFTVDARQFSVDGTVSATDALTWTDVSFRGSAPGAGRPGTTAVWFRDDTDALGAVPHTMACDPELTMSTGHLRNWSAVRSPNEASMVYTDTGVLADGDGRTSAGTGAASTSYAVMHFQLHPSRAIAVQDLLLLPEPNRESDMSNINLYARTANHEALDPQDVENERLDNSRRIWWSGGASSNWTVMSPRYTSTGSNAMIRFSPSEPLRASAVRLSRGASTAVIMGRVSEASPVCGADVSVFSPASVVTCGVERNVNEHGGTLDEARRASTGGCALRVDLGRTSAHLLAEGTVTASNVSIVAPFAVLSGLVTSTALGHVRGQGPGAPPPVDSSVCSVRRSGASAGHGGVGGRACKLATDECGRPTDSHASHQRGGIAYGSLAFPSLWGSGGADSFNFKVLGSPDRSHGRGGAGGGVIRVEAPKLLAMGTSSLCTYCLEARGQQGTVGFESDTTGGGGSGGSVAIRASTIVALGGGVDVRGGAYGHSGNVGSSGSGGRVLVRARDAPAPELVDRVLLSVQTTSHVGCFGGAGSAVVEVVPELNFTEPFGALAAVGARVNRTLFIRGVSSDPLVQAETPWPWTPAQAAAAPGGVLPAHPRTSDSAKWRPERDVSMLEPIAAGFLDAVIIDNAVVHALPGTAVSARHVHVGAVARVQGDERLRVSALELENAGTITSVNDTALDDDDFRADAAANLARLHPTCSAADAARSKTYTVVAESQHPSTVTPEVVAGASSILSDGNPTTGIVSVTNRQSWLEFDFGSPISLDHVDVTGTASSLLAAADVSGLFITVSEDGVTYSDVWTGGRSSSRPTAQPEETAFLRWPTRTARYWRINGLYVRWRGLGVADVDWGCGGSPNWALEPTSALECTGYLCSVTTRQRSPGSRVFVYSDVTGSRVGIEAADRVFLGDVKLETTGRGYGPAAGPGTPATAVEPRGACRERMSGAGASYGGSGGWSSTRLSAVGCAATDPSFSPPLKPVSAYGGSTAPTHFGSGGGPSWEFDCRKPLGGDGRWCGSGGAGGGAIAVTTNRLHMAHTSWLTNGERGGSGAGTTSTSGGGGSGGSILVTATSVTGFGDLQANGGGGLQSSRLGGGGSGGRVGLRLSGDFDPRVAITARGSATWASLDGIGAAGTIFVAAPSFSALYVENTGAVSGRATTPLPPVLPQSLSLVQVELAARLEVPEGGKILASAVRVDSTSHIEGVSFTVDALQTYLEKRTNTAGSRISAKTALVVTDASHVDTADPNALLWRRGPGFSRANPGWSPPVPGSGRIEGSAPACSSAAVLGAPQRVRSVTGQFQATAGRQCATSEAEARQFLLGDDDDSTGVCVSRVGSDNGGVVFDYNATVTVSRVSIETLRSQASTARATQTMSLLYTMDSSGVASPAWTRLDDVDLEEASASSGQMASSFNGLTFSLRHPVRATQIMVQFWGSGSLELGTMRAQCSSAGLFMTASQAATTANVPQLYCGSPGCSVSVSLRHPTAVLAIGGLVNGSTVSLAAPEVILSGEVNADRAGSAGGDASSDGAPVRNVWEPLVSTFAGEICAATSVVSGAGGSHGGHGGGSCEGSESCAPGYVIGDAHGLATAPWKAGAGGQGIMLNGQEQPEYGGNGGGRVRVEATSGRVHLLRTWTALEARIGASGGSGVWYAAALKAGGGGAGGSIDVRGTSISGIGTIAARGGDSIRSSYYRSGSGGGGRVAIRAPGGVSAEIGLEVQGGVSSETCAGSSGTVYTSTNTDGERLTVRNAVATTAVTPWPADAPSTLALAIIGLNARVALAEDAVLMGSRVRVHTTAVVEPLREFNGTLPSLAARTVRVRARQLDLYGTLEATGPGSMVSAGADVLTMKRGGNLNSGGEVEILGRDEMAARGDSLMSVRAASAAAGGSAWLHERICSASASKDKPLLFRAFQDSGSIKYDLQGMSAVTDGDETTFLQMTQSFDLYFVDERGNRTARDVNTIFGRTITGTHGLFGQRMFALRGHGEGAEREVDRTPTYVNFEDDQVSLLGDTITGSHTRAGYAAGSVSYGGGRFRAHFETPLLNITGFRFEYWSTNLRFPRLYELGMGCESRFVDMAPDTSLDCTGERCSVNVHASSSVLSLAGRIRGGDVDVRGADVVVPSSGLVDATATGFPADKGPGSPSETAEGQAKDVCGPTASAAGAGHGGRGGRAFSLSSSCGTPISFALQPRSRGGQSYGSATFPRDFGSGGGSGYSWNTAGASGGAGGGRILVNASGRVTISGDILANGGAGGYEALARDAMGGGGSGGSIVVKGDSGVVSDGHVRADGGACRVSTWYSGCGAGGRVAVIASRGDAVLHNMDTEVSAFGNSFQVSSGSAPGTVLREDATVRELHVIQSGRIAWEDEVETPWPLDLDGSLTLARVLRATVRVGLHPSSPLRVGDSLPGSSASSANGAVVAPHVQAVKVVADSDGWLVGEDLDVRALRADVAPNAKLTGKSRVRVRDYSFVDEASRLTLAGRCIAGGLRHSYSLVDGATMSALSRAALQDGDLSTQHAQHTLDFVFRSRVALSSLRMTMTRASSASSGLRVQALRTGGDPSVSADWETVTETTEAQPQGAYVNKWRRYMWHMGPESARWRVQSRTASRTLDVAELQWGCEGAHFMLDGETSCTGELCDVEIRGDTGFHATVIKGTVAGSSVIVADEHVQLEKTAASTGTPGVFSTGRGPAPRNRSTVAGFGDAGAGRGPLDCGWGILTGGSGGGHGGDGGTNNELGATADLQACGTNSMPGLSHGSATLPWTYGGPGADAIEDGRVGAEGGRGGGRIRLQGASWLDMQSGTMAEASGARANYFSSSGSVLVTSGTGAGGSVQLRAGEVEGDAAISAVGGDGYSRYTGGAGGGGRIAVYATRALSPGVTFDVKAGLAYTGARHGAAGTVYRDVAGRSELVIDARGREPGSTGYTPVPRTMWPADVPETVDVVRILSKAVVRAPVDATLRARRLEVDPDSGIVGTAFEMASASATIGGYLEATSSVKLSDSGFDSDADLGVAAAGAEHAEFCGARGPFFRPSFSSVWFSHPTYKGSGWLRVSAASLLDNDPKTAIPIYQSYWIEIDFGEVVPLTYMRAHIDTATHYVQVFASNTTTNASSTTSFPTVAGRVQVSPNRLSTASESSAYIYRFETPTYARYWQLRSASGTQALSSLAFGCGHTGHDVQFNGALRCSARDGGTGPADEDCTASVDLRGPRSSLVLGGQIRAPTALVNAPNAYMTGTIDAKEVAAIRTDAPLVTHSCSSAESVTIPGPGGSHGGEGGPSFSASFACVTPPRAAAAFGSALRPFSFGGSGMPGITQGAAVLEGGRGGGRVRIRVEETLALARDAVMIDATGGPVRVVGTDGAGAGAGGSIDIQAAVIGGRGTVAADGGRGVSTVVFPGCGSGGRIALRASLRGGLSDSIVARAHVPLRSLCGRHSLPRGSRAGYPARGWRLAGGDEQQCYD